MKCMSAMEGNGFDESMLTRWCQVTVSYLWKSVQGLQSVKSIWIAMSVVSDELRFGFNYQLGWDERKHERVYDFGNEWLPAMCCGKRVFNNT